MPSCCVRKCSNSWKKHYSMHRLPTGWERKQQWIANIGRNDLDPLKTYFICEAHFEAKMWEKPRIDGKKKLKEIAIPTIFLNNFSQNQNTASVDANDICSVPLHTEVHIEKTNNKDFSNNLMESTADNIDESCLSVTSIQNKDIENPLSRTSIHISEASIPAQFKADDIKTILEEAEQMKLKLQQANTIINKLDRSKSMLIKRVKRLMHNNKKLTEQINILKQTKNFKKILNNDQIKALCKKSTQGCKWSNDTIRKALRLKLSCGSSGYQELLDQGIPLPAERTLRRRSENIDFQPGVCEQILEILKQRVSEFTDD